ncbi:MAG: DUF167 domain-containing protein [Planctomycetota bacterium]
MIRLLAKALGVAPSAIELVSGETSRDKKVRLPATLDAATIRALAAN